jgi:hypothetical protein
MTEITTPGLIITDMDPDRYFEDPCPSPSLNQSLIRPLIRKSAYHAAHMHPRLNPYGSAPDTTRAMWLGSAVHRLALSRGKEISTIKYPDFRSSSARDARDLAIANGRIPILEKELVWARDMAAVLRRKIDEALDGAPYLTEVVVCWVEQTRYGPIWCRSMLDVVCQERKMILDPKALSSDATAEAFSKVSANSGYDLQAVFYPRGMEQASGAKRGSWRFANLVVEQDPPHGAQSFKPDEATKLTAEAVIAESMELWGKCLHSNEWPSYPKGVQTYSTPGWHQAQIEKR